MAKRGRKKGGKNKPKIISEQPDKSNFFSKDNEKTLHQKLNEIKSATEQAETIPKGNTIEQIAEQAEQPQPETKVETPEAEQPRVKRKYTKRSSKAAQDEDTPNDKKIDQIEMYVEVALLGLSHKFSKDFNEIKLSDSEKEMLLQLQPETDFLNKPSWFNYGLTSITMHLIKWFSAKAKIETQTPVETETEIVYESRKYKEGMKVETPVETTEETQTETGVAFN